MTVKYTRLMYRIIHFMLAEKCDRLHFVSHSKKNEKKKRLKFIRNGSVFGVFSKMISLSFAFIQCNAHMRITHNTVWSFDLLNLILQPICKYISFALCIFTEYTSSSQCMPTTEGMNVKKNESKTLTAFSFVLFFIQDFGVCIIVISFDVRLFYVRILWQNLENRTNIEWRIYHINIKYPCKLWQRPHCVAKRDQELLTLYSCSEQRACQKVITMWQFHPPVQLIQPIRHGMTEFSQFIG